MALLEENAEILARMERDGSDLGPSRLVDFSHIFPDQSSAEGFAVLAEAQGCRTSIEETDRDEDPWDVTVSREMVPSPANITVWEERLDALAGAHRGRSDGWGFFRI